MTTSTQIQIHEFSTGIQPDGTPDNWVSRGFTGEYMNKTINPIPPAVQNSISNREFAVAEGASSDDPAIIGREVQGNGEVWSVVAVVTRGRDDRGRSASMYRYFLCEGPENILKILAWIESQRKTGQLPVFDPFDSKVVGQPNEYLVSNLPEINLSDNLQSLLNNPAPVIIPFDQPCTPLIINQMASMNADGQPVAWAFKVEALEKPTRFKVIQPASERAEQILHKSIVSTPKLPAPVAEEQPIKSAIKGLIGREQIKVEQIQTILTALANPQIDDNYWKVIFDGQGATDALRQAIYNPQMVRLLTLQAMVIPETLQNYLSWMQKRSKQDDCYQVADNFQSEIKNYLNQNYGQGQNLNSRITKGVKLIIPTLINQKQLLEVVTWLLKSPKGIWSNCYFQGVNQDIDNDLSLMSRYSQENNQNFRMIDDNEWKKIITELRNYCRRFKKQYQPQEKYQPLAELFGELKNYEIAALFYQVGYGKVPKKIFVKICPNKWDIHTYVYDVAIAREVTIPERFLLIIIEIGGMRVPAAFVLVLVVISLIVGFLGGRFIPSNNSANNSNTNNTDSSPSSKPGSEYSTPSSSLPGSNISSNGINGEPPISLESLNQGKTNFNKTKEAIKEMQKRLAELGYNQQEIKEGIKNTITRGDKSIGLDYKDAIEGKATTRDEWIRAVYLYEKYQGKNKPDGFITKDSQTFKNILEEVKNNLQGTSNTSTPKSTLSSPP